jgi:hypothetical protein
MADQSTDDLVNQLLAQTTVAPQPSFMGLSAPPDPSQLQALLGKLRQQQYMQQVSQPTPGEYGFLHDAGRQGAAQIGQMLGNMLQRPGGLTGTPPTAAQPTQASATAPVDSSGATPSPPGSPPQPSAPQTPQAAVGAALMKGKQVFAAMLNAGVDPDVARLNTLKMLTSLGVPGADAKLADAQGAVDKSTASKAEASKNTAEAANYGSESQNRDARLAFEQKAGTWETIHTDPNGYYQLQRNGNGEVRRVEMAPNLSALVAAQPDQQASIAQMIANYQMAPLSAAALRSSSGQAIMAQVNQLNPNYDATQFSSKAKAMNSFSTGAEGKSVKSFNVALSHLDTLGQAANALGNGDINGVNKVANAISSWTGSTAPTDFNAIKGIVGDEVTKAILGSGGALADREEAKATINAANSPAQLQSVIRKYQSLMAGQLAGLRTQYENTTGRQDFEKKLEPRALSIARASPEYTSVFPNTPAGNGQGTATSNTSATANKPRVYNPQTGTFQ